MTNLYRIAAALAAAAVALPLAAQQTAPAPMQSSSQTPTMIDGAGAADVTTLTARVEGIDYANRTVTLQGKMGGLETLKVGPKVKNFAQIQSGDNIVLKYVEAISVKLEKGSAGGGASFTATGPVTAQVGAKPGAAAQNQTVIVASVQSVD